VWYAFTTPVDAQVSVFIFGSSYSPEVMVGVGTQGNLEQVGCGHGVTFLADGGVTYYVLVVDDQIDGGGNGGALRIAFSGAPTPTGGVTVDTVGRFDAPYRDRHYLWYLQVHRRRLRLRVRLPATKAWTVHGCRVVQLLHRRGHV
jgi:hypothetical protein